MCILGFIGLIVSRWLLIVGVVALIVVLRGLLERKNETGAVTNKNSKRILDWQKQIDESMKQQLSAVLADSRGVIDSNLLLTIMGMSAGSAQTFLKKDLDSLMHKMKQLGFAVVPNYNFGHKRLDYNEPCVIYSFPRNHSLVATPAVHQIELFLKLLAITMNGQELSQEDHAYIQRCIYELKAPDGYSGHLYAYMLWQMQKKHPYDRRTKDEVIALPDALKRRFMDMLLAAVSTSGSIDNARMEALKKIMPTLDVKPESIHSLLHQSLTDEGFATVEKHEGTREYTIRKPGEKKISGRTEEKKPEGLQLDESKLKHLMQQTQYAQDLLSDIFTAEEDEPVPAAPSQSSQVVEILEKLLEKDLWNRTEVEALMGPGVMLGSILEQINDYAYSKVDDIVVEEDGDSIYVTTEYKEYLI